MYYSLVPRFGPFTNSHNTLRSSRYSVAHVKVMKAWAKSPTWNGGQVKTTLIFLML